MDLNNNIYIGKNPACFSNQNVSGDEVTINGEAFYKITNFNKMRPFFMSIVSNSDHWMFISSTGGLSAGRKNSNYALFPYYTDDKITESSEHTGSKSIFIVRKGEKNFLWEPLSNRQDGVYEVSRNLYKNAYGNKVIFEEVNHDLQVSFSYEWNSSDDYGFIRQSTLKNLANTAVDIRLLDGIQNILPHGVEVALQNSTSNLVDAYKKCELETDSGLGIYSLSAIIVDKAEPSEALKANVVWSLGLNDSKKLISSTQVNDFRRGKTITEEVDIKAERGAYLLTADLTLKENAQEQWTIVANVNHTINDIINELKKPGLDPRSEVQLFEFANIYAIEDVAVGMIVPGIVTNITRFGAFVDIGVKQDGLVHVSEIAHQYITDPSEFLKLGQKVQVKITEIDIARKRIALSIKQTSDAPAKTASSKPAAPKPAPDQDLSSLSVNDALQALKKRFGK